MLDALLRTGTPTPFFCRSGICGQCKSVLVRGEVMQVGSAPPILSDEEVREGAILICRSVALTNCEIVPEHLPVRTEELPWPAQVEVSAATWITPGLFHLRVEASGAEGGEMFLFHPGQYSYLLDPQQGDWDLPSRLYPATRPGCSFLDFYLFPDSAQQARSFDEAFRRGSRVNLARPVGASCLKEGEKGPVIIVANGEGLPAVLSMVGLLRVRENLSDVNVIIRGDAADPLSQEVFRICHESGIAARSCESDAVSTELDRGARALTEASSKRGWRAQAYVKGDESLVKMSRKILYAHGMRPWEVHAEILAGAVPQL